jgi:ubiquinone/menaquinone biosynthesis C-methylase UbiE/uncharacterized membrane protein YbhN (UPF0104 family)
MASRALDHPSAAARQPLAVAWVVILASALAVLVVGVLATGLILADVDARAAASSPAFWLRLAGACILTLASVSIRGLRWVFLLRRAETRIPIRDAVAGYLAGLSLLFAPLLLGEIAVRATVNRARGGVPFLTTALVNVWERLMDVVAIGIVTIVAAALMGEAGRWSLAAAALVAVSLASPVRRAVLSGLQAVLTPFVRQFDRSPARPIDRLARLETWSMGMLVSVVAWSLPGMGLWLLAESFSPALSLLDAERTFARAAAAGTAYLAPGGVLVAGPDMLAHLRALGFEAQAAALTVLGVRLATVGVSIALGWVFVAWSLRSSQPESATHFDDIADAYDVQIPEARRRSLLDVKTRLMREILEAGQVGRRGLDVGCGQGAYVARMRALGFDVSGIDASAGQIRLAARNLDDPAVVSVGSVLNIPAADESFDFVYVINVLHHLDSVEQQRRALSEIFRTLKPGGLLFIHEINTRNVLFRFYMGYVFPSLNCIDEGVERWLRPDQLAEYTDAAVREVRYFTFLPDFVPAAVVRILRPVEGWLEGSGLRVYSAHYMAALQKAGRDDR